MKKLLFFFSFLSLIAIGKADDICVPRGTMIDGTNEALQYCPAVCEGHGGWNKPQWDRSKTCYPACEDEDQWRVNKDCAVCGCIGCTQLRVRYSPHRKLSASANYTECGASHQDAVEQFFDNEDNYVMLQRGTRLKIGPGATAITLLDTILTTPTLSVCCSYEEGQDDMVKKCIVSDECAYSSSKAKPPSRSGKNSPAKQKKK